MKVNRASYRVRTRCRVLEVSASGFYAWLHRGPSKRSRANAALLGTIQEIREESDGTYGAPRIHAELPDRGVQASLNRVARVMSAAEIQGVSRRKGTRITWRGRDAQPAADLVNNKLRTGGLVDV